MSKYIINDSDYKAMLDKVYNGTVTNVEKYISPQATLKHKCSDCGVIFFAKPTWLVSRESQKHICEVSHYGDARSGERLNIKGRGGIDSYRPTKRPKEPKEYTPHPSAVQLAESMQLLKVGYSIKEVTEFTEVPANTLLTWSKIMGVIPNKGSKYKPVGEDPENTGNS